MQQPKQPETIVIEDDDDENDEEEEEEEIDIKDSLMSVFDSVEQIGGGNFTCGGALDYFYGLPGLEIALPSSSATNEQSSSSNERQYKPIGLPIITKEQAFELIQHCSKAPYGKGEETIYDDAVRKTWQLGPENFRMSNPKWAQMITNLLDEKVKSGLGVPATTPITCTLYKLLLYEEGGHFDFHRDTEKEDKMFATMVVQLPSVYSGGEIIVQHGNSEETYDLSKDAAYTPFYFSFYSDCKHCVRPVTSGYRLCLVYNVVYTGRSEIPQLVDNSALLKELTRTVDAWETDGQLVVYLLDHKYSKAGLRFDCLKGEDASKYQILEQYMSKRDDLQLYLGIMTKTESGGGSYGDYEFYDTFYAITHCVDINNYVVDMKISLDESDIIPTATLEDLPMDGQEVSFFKNCN